MKTNIVERFQSSKMLWIFNIAFISIVSVLFGIWLYNAGVRDGQRREREIYYQYITLTEELMERIEKTYGAENE